MYDERMWFEREEEKEEEEVNNIRNKNGLLIMKNVYETLVLKRET